VSGLILHHFDLSPFAEKIRKVFGVKNIDWYSVQIPMIMPKPDLMPLTGGYRKTPVLQIGADTYCDTSLIVDVLEDLYPAPTLFGSGRLTNHAFQTWSDREVFPFSAALSLHENAENLPDSVIRDRREYFSFLDFEKFEADAPHFRAQFAAHATKINEQLSDNRDFLLGRAPEWADINACLNIWTAHGHIPGAARMFDGLGHMNAWYARMTELGEGRRTEVDAHYALDVAQKSTPDPVESPDTCSGAGEAAVGTTVTVTPTDYGCVPVTGTLADVSATRISISRSSGRTGDVNVHFPRTGFRVEAMNGR